MLFPQGPREGRLLSYASQIYPASYRLSSARQLQAPQKTTTKRSNVNICNSSWTSDGLSQETEVNLKNTGNKAC